MPTSLLYPISTVQFLNILHSSLDTSDSIIQISSLPFRGRLLRRIDEIELPRANCPLG